MSTTGDTQSKIPPDSRIYGSKAIVLGRPPKSRFIKELQMLGIAAYLFIYIHIEREKEKDIYI